MSIDKRIYKGRPQYRCRFRYKDFKGNVRQTGSKWFDSSAEAKKAEAKLLALYSGSASGLPFFKVAMEYIEDSKTHNVPKTIRQKEYMLEEYCEPLFYLDIDRITTKQIRDLLYNNELFMSKATNTKNRVRSFLHSVFKYGQAYYGLKSNPVDSIPTFRRTDEERLREMNIYTPEQFKLFLSHVKGEEYAALYYVLYWTGMRVNEANSLTFRDIFPKKIRLYRQYVDGKWRSLKTTGSSRDIAIDSKLWQVFEHMREHWSSYDGFTDDWFCFGGHRQLATTTIERVKDRAVRDSGLPEIRIHDFRHSHASNLIEAGVNIYKISKRLGHSSISITMDRYGHLIDRDGEEIISALERSR